MRRNYYYFILLIFTIFNTQLNAQHVDAGDDIYLCPGETTATLHADVSGDILTGRYKVEAIQFQWDRDLTNAQDVTITTGGSTTPLRIDDNYGDAIDLPFPISFFGQTYDQIVVGSNGDIIFEPSVAGDFDAWNIDPTETIPNHTLPYWDDSNSLSYASILGAYYDIDISKPSPTKELKYKVSGTAPNRKFTIMYLDVPLFSCTSKMANQEIIFNEADHSFEVHIKTKPSCTGWNDGLAVLGIQNEELLPDTCGYYPGDVTSPTLPNRNTSVWSVDAMNPEAYKFVPDANITYTWKDSNGNVLGNEADLEVQPTANDTEYTVEITYEDCHGNVYSEFDSVMVHLIPEPQVELPEDNVICQGDTFTLDGTLTNEADYSSVNYTWEDENHNVISNEATVEISGGGQYYLNVDINGMCARTFGPIALRLYEACKIPEGISPNGDGLNDAFILDYYAGEYGIDTFQVFDRRGVLLYEKDNYVRDFVGKDNDGNDLPAATYYYVLKLMNGEKYTGWFQLIR